MDQIVYIASDGSGMNTEDVISWVKYELSDGIRSFDKVTGGVLEFTSEKSYFQIKSLFE